VLIVTCSCRSTTTSSGFAACPRGREVRTRASRAFLRGDADRKAHSRRCRQPLTGYLPRWSLWKTWSPGRPLRVGGGTCKQIDHETPSPNWRSVGSCMRRDFDTGSPWLRTRACGDAPTSSSPGSGSQSSSMAASGTAVRSTDGRRSIATSTTGPTRSLATEPVTWIQTPGSPKQVGASSDSGSTRSRQL
jgi:hypothetical protein